MREQLSAEEYRRAGYDTKGRFCSYWHQVNSVESLRPARILEIGVGNGFFARHMRSKGHAVTTADVLKGLRPDVVGSVEALPVRDLSFDVVACFEVMEHVPFEYFRRGLAEIHRVARRHCVLSVPDVTRCYRFNVQIPKLGDIARLIQVPRLLPLEMPATGEHYWEIGRKGYPRRRIGDAIEEAGFRIVSTFRVFELSWQRFFVLAKPG